MKFDKLALAAAVAAAPATGMAMEPMQDSQMSNVTGQDGISIKISNTSVDTNVGIEDTDGITDSSNHTSPGLLYVDGQHIDTGSDSINIEMDTGGTASGNSNSGMLQVDVRVDTLNMDTGDIYAVGGTDGSDVDAGITNVTGAAGSTQVTGPDPIIESTSVTLNNVSLTVQLGDEETDFLNINSTSTLTVGFGTLGTDADNFTINDADGSSISMDRQEIQNITFGSEGIKGNVEDKGLTLSIGTDALTDINMAMMGIALGDTGSMSGNPAPDNTGALGNVYVTGLDVSNTDITIAGH